MKQAALVIIKPDGISKGLTGAVLTKLAEADLEFIGFKIANATKELAEEHYKHLKDMPFFKSVISYLMGKGYKRKKLLAIVYYGEHAIKKCRKIAGATNPEEAHPYSIRGSFGRITSSGLYENVVHVSSDAKEAEREIKLWFKPDEITRSLYSTKIQLIEAHKERVWA